MCRLGMHLMRSDLHVCHCPCPAAFQTFLPQLFCPGSTGSLPVEWDLQRVGDMGVGVELENWVEPSRPRNDKEKLHDFIVQEGLLQLQPPVGQLGPGKSTTWTITYRQACAASSSCTCCNCDMPYHGSAWDQSWPAQSLEAGCFCQDVCHCNWWHSIAGTGTSQCFTAAVEPSWFTGSMQRTTTSPRSVCGLT